MYIKCSAKLYIYQPKKKINKDIDLVYFPNDLDSVNVTDEERQEMVDIMQSYQRKIADDAISCFPTSLIMGGFYDFSGSGWYPSGDSLKWYGANSVQYFTWTNFTNISGNHTQYNVGDIETFTITGFGWAPDGDDVWYGYKEY